MADQRESQNHQGAMSEKPRPSVGGAMQTSGQLVRTLGSRTRRWCKTTGRSGEHEGKDNGSYDLLCHIEA